jgi:hypothetical protein
MNLRRMTLAVALLASLAALRAPAAEKLDIKRAVPPESYLAIYAKNNPERDYQRTYLKEALQTARDEHIGRRIVDIITSKAPKDKLDQAREKWNEVKEALEPIKGKAILDAKELAFAELMVAPFNHYVIAVREKSADNAADCFKATSQMFDLAVKWSDGKLSVEDDDAGEATMKTLRLPKKSPYHPTIAKLGDIVLFASTPKLAKSSLEQLQDSDAQSKFEDKRFAEALEHLPKPEDTLLIFDGAQLWKSLGEIGDFIRHEKPDDKDAEKAAKVIDDVLNEVAIIDYTVNVEYTEDGQNRCAVYGKLADDYDDKVLGKALTQGKPFTDWEKWVPADAKSYSLCTGVNLHVIYDALLNYVRDEFPKSHQALDHWAEVQEKAGVNLDEDILQNFSGETVSITLPPEGDNGSKNPQQVIALKCKDPDKIKELLNRAVERLNKFPAVQAQNLSLEDVDDLEGFQEVRANFFAMGGVQPVIGFKDGWMIIGSTKGAAKRFVDVRDGKADSLDAKKIAKKFGVKIDGDVYAVSYTDVGAGIRQFADGLDYVGRMAPLFLSMASTKGAKAEDMKPINDALSLLPSVAKVVRKFDFFEDRLKVTYEGPEDNTFMQQSVTLIRQPGEKENAKDKDSDSNKESDDK